MKTYILAIDQGTTSSRAILFDHNSDIIGMAQKELTTKYPHPGWVEQDANEIWAVSVGVIYEVMAKCGIKETQIAAIGLTNQRETTIVWDKESGQPIYPAIVWQSRQSHAYIEDWKREGREAWVKQKTGLLLDPYFSASKIRFILDHVEGAQARAEAGELLFGTVDSWLLWKLTNGKRHITDVSNASRTLLMNIQTLDYDEELLALWNIPRVMLPQICDSSDQYGIASGLSDVPMMIGSMIGDQQASLFGQCCFEAGSLKNTYGTGCFLLMNTEDQIIESTHGLLTCAGWRIGEETCYVLEGSVFVAGAAVQWLRDGLKIIETSKETQRRAEQLNSSEGVYVVPAFTGLGAPYWNASAQGAIFGLTRGTTQEHIIRSTLESLAFQTYDVIEAMRQDSHLDITSLQVDGGVAENEFLLQFQADLLQCEVRQSLIRETTALGAAYLAGLAVGYWRDKEAIKAQARQGKRFLPSSDQAKQRQRLEGWHRAIQGVLTYSQS